jgi:hypothetical protein
MLGYFALWCVSDAATDRSVGVLLEMTLEIQCSWLLLRRGAFLMLLPIALLMCC